MYECPKDCLSCANSFSEPAKNENEPDILHCVEKNGIIVKDTDCCELYKQALGILSLPTKIHRSDEP